jgi:hypothetical protein
VVSSRDVIISHRHRYLFVELPRTGSTAIRRELRTHYDGEVILHKHATYEEFLKQASPEEKTYFVFSGIRNPLDAAVSLYFKLKTDHNRRMSDPSRRPKHKPLLNRLLHGMKFGFLRRTDADFATYFMRYYVLPHDTSASLSHERIDFVIRFENLAEGFEEALRRIGIEPVRPLPLANATAKRDRDYRQYYPPRTWKRARRVFGPYMTRWGYEFPAEWQVGQPSLSERATYGVFSFFAKLYWRFIRPIT